MLNEIKWFSNEENRIFSEEVLGETDAKREELIGHIRTWIDDNPKLHARRDDRTILAFLRGCKFNLDKTQQKMWNFYKMKTEIPEWFANRDPSLPIIQELVDLGVFVPLRKFHKNQLVCIIRTGVHNPKIHSQNDVFKTGKMIFDLAIKENFENCTIYGISAIFDMGNVGLLHAQQLPPNVIKKSVFAWQNYTCRPKQLEFVNAQFYMNVVLNIFKSFMTSKLKNRVRIHFSGLESLHQVVDKDILPVEYGGTNGTLKELTNYWKQKLDENKEWFKEDEQYKLNLSD